jgi:hypothetical protein
LARINSLECIILHLFFHPVFNGCQAEIANQGQGGDQGDYDIQEQGLKKAVPKGMKHIRYSWGYPYCEQNICRECIVLHEISRDQYCIKLAHVSLGQLSAQRKYPVSPRGKNRSSACKVRYRCRLRLCMNWFVYSFGKLYAKNRKHRAR